jgi:DsbC/DsbD-like thiol-disulfide interchange protein
VAPGVAEVAQRKAGSNRQRGVKGFAASADLPEGCHVARTTCSFILLFLGGWAALTLASPAGAQSAPPSHAKIELIADNALLSGGTIWVGLLFRLDPGWHIYWQNPGDSGTPPRVEWRLPAGYRADAIRWPTPIRLGHGSVVDYAYEGEVLLMVPIERASNSPGEGALSIAADLKYVVCSEVCIPGKAHLTLALPWRSGARSDTAGDPLQWHAIFERTRAQLPRPAPTTWKVSAEASRDEFVLSVHTGVPVQSAAFFPLDPDEIENSAPQVFASTRDGFRLTLRKSEQSAKPVATLRGLVVLGPQQRAFEIAAPVATR